MSIARDVEQQAFEHPRDTAEFIRSFGGSHLRDEDLRELLAQAFDRIADLQKQLSP